MSDTIKLAADIGREIMLLGGDDIQPMTKDQSVMMLQCIFLEREKPDDTLEDANGIFSYDVLKGRVDYAKLNVSPAVILFLAYMSDRPGVAVMYAAALKRLSQLVEGQKITMDVLCRDGFPWGFPTNDALHKIWDAQKYRGKGSDNSLDHAESWELGEQAA